jgi:chemotaxis protein CheX
MACKMLGLGPNEVDQHMWDAVGEVCNMVAGNFKNKLVGLSEHCMLSVPTVITGADYCLHSLADGGSLEVVLIFEGEPIVVALELHT